MKINGKICIAIAVSIGLLMFACNDENSNSGILARNPSDVITRMIDCWKNGNDYTNLCSVSISTDDVSSAASVFLNAKASNWLILDDGNSYYEKLKGTGLKLKDNQALYGIVSTNGQAGDFHLGIAEKFEGYAIVERHKKTNRYYIVEMNIKAN